MAFTPTNFDIKGAFFNATQMVTPSDTATFEPSMVRVGDITTVGAVIKWKDWRGNVNAGYVIGQVGEFLPSPCIQVYATGTTAAAISRSGD